MTDAEIIRSYQETGTRKKGQISILAQLNNCTRYDIINRLMAAGIKISDKEYIKRCEHSQEQEREEIRALDIEAKKKEKRR